MLDGVLPPGVAILQRKQLIGFKSLKMAIHSRFANQASHRVTLRRGSGITRYE
jgi:hypothetical protein